MALRPSVRTTHALVGTAHGHRAVAVAGRAAPELVLRAYRPGDRFAVQAMADDLSPATLHARFLVGVPALPRAYVDRLDAGSAAPSAVVVATVGPFVVGVGELVVQPAVPSRGELALLVRDGYQRRGIGLALAGRLVRHAHRHGLVVLEVEALSGSRAVRAMVRRHFPRASAVQSGSTIHYELAVRDLRP